MAKERQDLEAAAAALAQAVSAAEQGRNQYRVFQDGLEVLRKAQGIVQGLREYDAQRTAILKDIQALSERKTELAREVEGLQQAAKDEKAQTDTAIATERRRLKDETDHIRAEADRVRVEAQEHATNFKFRLDEAKKAQAEALKPMEQEREALQRKVDELKMELAEILAKYRG